MRRTQSLLSVCLLSMVISNSIASANSAGAGNEMGETPPVTKDYPLLPSGVFYNQLGYDISNGYTFSELVVNGPLNVDELVESDDRYLGVTEERYQMAPGRSYNQDELPLIPGGVYEFRYSVTDNSGYGYDDEDPLLLSFEDDTAEYTEPLIAEILDSNFTSDPGIPRTDYVYSKIRLLKVNIDVDKPSDPETFKVESIIQNSDLLHFVTAARQGDVVLKADLPDSIKDQVSWETTAAGITLTESPTDKRIVSVSTEAANTKDGVQIPFKLKIGGTVVKDGNIWVVWSQVTQEPNFTGFTPSYAGLALAQQAQSGLSLNIISMAFQIVPSSIVDTNADIPDLTGPNVTQPPVVNGAEGVFPDFGTSATTRWDLSRQIRLKYSDLDLVSGIRFQPSNIPTGNYPNFPIDAIPQTGAVIGNDDPNDFTDLTGAPYFNDLSANDAPSCKFLSAVGSVGDTAEARYHFIEFMRLNLGDSSTNGKWFPISEPFRWKVHFRMRKVEDGNNLDGASVTDEIWIDNGSIGVSNNDDFNENF